MANGNSGGSAGGITNSGTLLITNSTFSDNTDTASAGGAAGAIFNSGTLFITNSTFSGNSDNVLGSAGAIWNNGQVILTSDTFSANSDNPQSGAAFFNYSGTATITNSTFSGNTGGAIENGKTLTVINSTFSGNTLENSKGSYLGAAIYTFGGTATLENTILVDSNATNCESNGGTIVDGGYNLDDDGTCGLSSANHSLSHDPDADLDPLASNGGLTQTFALESDSDAIAKIPPGVNGCATTVPNDQRGVSRPQSADGYCSMGAYEAYNTITAIITDCSDDTQLQAAVSSGGRIVFDCGGTITLTKILTTSGPTLIDGNGQNVTLSGGGSIPVIYSGYTLILHGLSIENGHGFGGAQNLGTMVVTDSTFANNFGDSGAILNKGPLLIVTNSTFSGNSSTNGSAIDSDPGLTTNLVIATGSTFSGNSVIGFSENSVVFAQSGTVTFQNSLIAGNTLNGGSECEVSHGVFTDLGYNLDDDGSCGFSSANHSLSNNQNSNPGALSSNGGPTQTVPLTYPSTAIDAIPITASACGVSPDQRGVLRPQGLACDMGAFEANEIPVPFATNPANLSYEVGTTAYATAQVPFLVVGGEYPLSTTSPQSGGTGTQYVWENWSDNGGIEHTITIPSTPVSYTANFGMQYYLTMAVNPPDGGNVSPGSSWQDATAVVDISASANPGFQFSNWTGSTVANSNTSSTTITMSGPESVTANFLEPPSITSASSTTFTVGTAGTFTVTTTGYPTVTTISDGSATLPNNLTFTNNGNGTATLSGTPAAGTGGVYKFTITASNGVSPNASQSFTLYVDQAPAITSASSTTFTVGVAGSFTVTTTGYPPPSIMESGGLPGGVGFVDNHDGTGTLSGTPTSGGVFSISFTASNGVGSNAVQAFTLTVDQAPSLYQREQRRLYHWRGWLVYGNNSGLPNSQPNRDGPSADWPHVPRQRKRDGDAGWNSADIRWAATSRSPSRRKMGLGAPVTENFVIIVQQPPFLHERE